MELLEINARAAIPISDKVFIGDITMWRCGWRSLSFVGEMLEKDDLTGFGETKPLQCPVRSVHKGRPHEQDSTRDCGGLRRQETGRRRVRLRNDSHLHHSVVAAGALRNIQVNVLAFVHGRSNPGPAWNSKKSGI